MLNEKKLEFYNKLLRKTGIIPFEHYDLKKDEIVSMMIENG